MARKTLGDYVLKKGKEGIKGKGIKGIKFIDNSDKTPFTGLDNPYKGLVYIVTRTGILSNYPDKDFVFVTYNGPSRNISKIKSGFFLEDHLGDLIYRNKYVNMLVKAGNRLKHLRKTRI